MLFHLYYQSHLFHKPLRLKVRHSSKEEIYEAYFRDHQRSVSAVAAGFCSDFVQSNITSLLLLKSAWVSRIFFFFLFHKVGGSKDLLTVGVLSNFECFLTFSVHCSCVVVTGMLYLPIMHSSVVDKKR